MPTFQVLVTRTISEYTHLEVEAVSADAAIEQVNTSIEAARTDGGYHEGLADAEWEFDEIESGPIAEVAEDIDTD